MRDFDFNRNVKSKIESQILNDLNALWEDIKKPERFQNSLPSNFFEFEFSTLPHKKYKANEFDQQCQELRKKLSPNHPDYLFNHVNSAKNIPADGLKQYLQQIWGDILSEKELNIPSQKEMLANYRCNEIKDEIIAKHKAAVKEIQIISSKQTVENFKNKCLEIYNQAIEEYDKTASNYVDKIYQNVRGQLANFLSQRFYVAFENQVKRMLPISQKFMRQDLEKELKKSII